MNWAYIVGFIDADGTIYISRKLDRTGDHHPYSYVTLCIYQKDPPILHEIKQLLLDNGCTAINVRPVYGRTRVRNQMWRLEARTKHDMIIIFSVILRYIRIKGPRVVAGLQIATRKQGHGNSIIEVIR